MDTALVSPEAVALLSQITGQKLSQRQLTLSSTQLIFNQLTPYLLRLLAIL
jgi:hypothetical protein